MNKVLKDALAVKRKQNGDYPFEFEAPSYDNRTSCSMKAGDDYGTGHTNPVGRFAARPIKEGPIPQESHSFLPKEIFEGEDRKG
jgi:hypothetical protein